MFNVCECTRNPNYAAVVLLQNMCVSSWRSVGLVEQTFFVVVVAVDVATDRRW